MSSTPARWHSFVTTADKDGSDLSPPKGRFAFPFEIFGREGRPGAENSAVGDFCRS